MARTGTELPATTESERADDIKVFLSGKSDKKRAEIAKGLGDRIGADLSEFDRETAIELARQLAEDAIVVVRRTLAESVKDSRFLPKQIGLKIAYDVEDVAVPFLEATSVFSENELCQIVRSARQFAKAAVARRKDLSARIADEIAAYGDLAAVTDLVDNHTAKIDEESYRILLERFEGRQALFDRVSLRPDLAMSIIAELVLRISEHAREALSERYDISVDFLNPIIEESRINALLEIIERSNFSNIEILVKGMSKRGDLTPPLLLAAVRNGYLMFFEHAMASLAGINVQNTRRLVREGDDEATVKLCEKAKIPSSLHNDFLKAIAKAVEERAWAV